MKTYDLLGQKYELIEEEEHCFSYDLVLEKMTDYFLPFDYIFGDYAGEKLRLKGFYEKNHVDVKSYNNIDRLPSYKKDYCAYGAKTFLLKKKK